MQDICWMMSCIEMGARDDAGLLIYLPTVRVVNDLPAGFGVSGAA
jgi:hypothetical protein